MERRNAEDGKAGEGGDCDAMDGRDGEGSEAEPYLDLFQRNKSRTKEKRREKRDRQTDADGHTGLFKRIWSKVAVKHWMVIAQAVSCCLLP